MSGAKGYVSVHRTIQDHWLWDDKPFSKGQAWIDMILTANYKDEKFTYKDVVIEGKRGTVYRSISSLAARWGWSRDKARRFLKQLESDGMIAVHASTHQTTISIINYGFYQDQVTAGVAAKRQPVGSRPSAGSQQADTYNKDNNSNKGNKKNNSKSRKADSKQTGIPVQTPEELAAADDWFNSL